MVAKKRQQICDMKLLLAAKLNGQQTPINPDASDGEAERARKLFLEVWSGVVELAAWKRAGVGGKKLFCNCGV